MTDEVEITDAERAVLDAARPKGLPAEWQANFLAAIRAYGAAERMAERAEWLKAKEGEA